MSTDPRSSRRFISRSAPSHGTARATLVGTSLVAWASSGSGVAVHHSMRPRGPHSFGSMLSSRHPRDAAVFFGPAIALSACRWRPMHDGRYTICREAIMRLGLDTIGDVTKYIAG